MGYEMGRYDMSSEEYAHAQNYWHVKDREAKGMDRETVYDEIGKFLSGHNTCALATASDGQVRCTPLEYTWHDGSIWIFSEGGEKFCGLEQNKNVSLAVYDPYGGFGSLKGLQVTGRAEMVEPFSELYCRDAEIRKIPLSALKALKEPMHLIRIIPGEFIFTNSEFKKQGYSSRQIYTAACRG